jgi:hypothetical protein
MILAEITLCPTKKEMSSSWGMRNGSMPAQATDVSVDNSVVS